ncbi:hypothetical protein [Pseudoalteromonas sp. T1lg22]|uniref:hypothetical protein n=1 Tax=Pseudoalteromonas sp. T1lg22 TaxID=2077096 RepID=UPI000CF6D224|nr:hypothetical protein [Pseudoalteromonas sp. T1lg22]
MKSALPLLLFTALLLGCSSAPDERQYEIHSQDFYAKLDDQGRKIFAYVMTVKASKRAALDLNKPISRKQMKTYIEREHFDESRVLKLQLEDEAAAALKKELKERDYCPDAYEINQVLWRDFSVQLRGVCL